MKLALIIFKRRFVSALLCSVLPFLMISESLARDTDSPTPKRVHSILRHNPFQVPDFARETNSSSMMSVSASGEGLELRGILMSSKNPMVNINGEIMSIGQVIDGYKLLDITEKNAVFEKQENRITLDLLKDKAN